MELQPTLNNFLTNKVDWHKYNLAKTNEKRLFYRLLFELCELIPEPSQRTGRPKAKVRDLVFCCALKLYSNYSGRKVMSDLKHAELAGYISKAMHYNTMSDFLNCEETYDLLQKLLTWSAMPLKNLEDSFSIDSSGFGAYQYERWMKAKFHGKRSEWRNFIKGHIAIGTRTNIICACEITPGHWADVTQAPKLIQNVGDNFNMKELSADKAYASKRVMQLTESLGAMPYIPFKINTQPNKRDDPKIWLQMYDYFKRNQADFMKHYHKRSNVETTFMMVKQRLGEFLKSKTIVAQRNELMMKFICHNICCLVAEIFESNAHINFRESVKKYINRPPQDLTEKDNRSFVNLHDL